MGKASIALNRFGLGARPGEAPGSDPARWLLSQFDRYDAKPQEIAALAPSGRIASELTDYLREVRVLQRAKRRQAAAEPAMETEPAMRGSPMQPMPDTEDKSDDPVAQARRRARQQGRDHYARAVSARALVALNAPAPFVERLVHFWANHFAVSADKLTMVGLAGSLEFEAVRPHVLGKFGDMLHAVERHPAMLVYLDQAQSVGPNSAFGQMGGRRGQKAGLNENLAREILELHTLGVRTGYSQADVTEFAKAMTGRTVAGLGRGRGPAYAEAGEAGNFVFAPRLHEPGTRNILGRSWPQEGEAQAAAVLDLLSTHPATARHIATKLARHFAGDEPPPALVGKLEAAFLRSGGDLPTVYRALVEAPECWVAQPVKFKSPWEWTISALRGLGAEQLPPMAMNGLMTQLGQPVWKPGSPAGWDDVAASWAGPDAVMRRVEAAERLAQRTRDTVDARKRAAELLPDSLSENSAQSIARAESPGQGVALMLIAPEFMRR